MWRTATVAILVLALFQLCATQNELELNSPNCVRSGPLCSDCFNQLVAHTLNSDRNQLAMQEAFFPADASSPIYMEVSYFYEGTEDPIIWFWSANTYYALFSPLHIHQFASLLFGDPAFRSTTLHLMLPADCINATEDMMHLLTQRVRSHNVMPPPYYRLKIVKYM